MANGILVFALWSAYGFEALNPNLNLPVSLGLYLFGYFLSAIFMALTISVLSMAFRHCTGWYPPGEEAALAALPQGPSDGRLDLNRGDGTGQDAGGRP